MNTVIGLNSYLHMPFLLWVSAARPSTYDLANISDLQSLLWAHQQYQTTALMNAASQRPPAVLVTSNDLVGLGNRVPAIITGYVLALLTKRVLLLQSSLLDYMHAPFPVDWHEFEHHYKGASACAIDWRMLVNRTLDFCDSTAPGQQHQQQVVAVLSDGVPTAGSSMPDLIRYSSIDYDLPLLQVNPALRPHFRKYFPNGEVFHSTAQFLLHAKPVLQAAMLPYLPGSGRCQVGMHVRTRKYGGVRLRQFTSIARMLAQGKNGTVFVASDAGLFDACKQPCLSTECGGRITQAMLWQLRARLRAAILAQRSVLSWICCCCQSVSS